MVSPSSSRTPSSSRGGVSRKRSRPKGEGSDSSCDESIASDQAVISSITKVATVTSSIRQPVTPSPPKRLKLLPVAPSLQSFLVSPTRYRPQPKWIALSSRSRAETASSSTAAKTSNDVEAGKMTNDPSAGATVASLVASQPFGDDQKETQDSSTPPRRTEEADEGDGDESGDPRTAALFTFGPDQDTALHFAIRHDATTAALALLGQSTGEQEACDIPVQQATPNLHVVANAQNAKGATPLMLASQRGHLPLVKILLGEPHHIDPCAHVTKNGSTALLQASHHGHAEVCRLLLKHGAVVDKANRNLTTPLMRASQEGHLEVVQVLLKAGARVSAVNHEQMSPLMLASQRGHARVVRLLLEQGAPLNAATAQNSTSLMLATKRNNVGVVRVLLAAGCETAQADHRGRTALEIALRRRRSHEAQALRQAGEDNNNNDDNNNNSTTPVISDELIRLLSKSSEQVRLIRLKHCKKRNFEMAKLYRLLQQERAHVDVRPLTPRGAHSPPVSIHHAEIVEEVLQDRGEVGLFPIADNSTRALVRTMSLLPAPLMELVAQFIPPPNMWEDLLLLAQRRVDANVHSAILLCWDIMDEILEEGGFLQACDANQITAPQGFTSWTEWEQSRTRRRRAINSRRVKSSSGSEDGSGGEDDEDAASDVAVVAGPAARFFWLSFQQQLQQRRNPVRDTLIGLPQLLPRYPLAGPAEGGRASRTAGALQRFQQEQEEYQPCYLHILAHGPTSLQEYLVHELGMMPTLVHRLVVSQDIQTLSRRVMQGSASLTRGNNIQGANAFIKFEPPMGRAVLGLTREVLNWYRHHRRTATAAATAT